MTSYDPRDYGSDSLRAQIDDADQQIEKAAILLRDRLPTLNLFLDHVIDGLDGLADSRLGILYKFAEAMDSIAKMLELRNIMMPYEEDQETLRAHRGRY